MFRQTYLRLKYAYNLTCKFYSSIVSEHPFVCIVCYLLLVCTFSFGLFQVKYNPDNESLTVVRQSQARLDESKLNELFTFDQHERYFQHQLTNLGYYFEVILVLKSPIGFQSSKDNCVYARSDVDHANYSIINAALFDEYNKFYDSIFSITIEDVNSNSNGSLRNYTYRSDLCARRLSKCAVEGGIMRAASFQRDLVQGNVKYDEADPKRAYLDVEAVDGTSVDFVFGKCRQDKCDKQSCQVQKAMLIRNRFDLLSNTTKEKELAVKFMHVFAEFMSNLPADTLPHFDYSFHTSHTLTTEIEKYSLVDMKYVGISLVMFWLIYTLMLLIDFKYLANRARRSLLNKIHNKTNKSNIKSKSNLFWVHGCGYLFIITMAQLLLTLLSSLGFVSLLSISINQLLTSIVFVLMVNSCHQSLLLYKNLSANLTSLSSRQPTDVQNKQRGLSILDDLHLKQRKYSEFKTCQQDIRTKLRKAVQHVIVPYCCSLCTTIAAYLVISLTSCFDSIRIYSTFLMICSSFNFIGLLFFFCPCIVLNMKRIHNNNNCLLFCIKHKVNYENNEDFFDANESNQDSNLNTTKSTKQEDEKDLTNVVTIPIILESDLLLEASKANSTISTELNNATNNGNTTSKSTNLKETIKQNKHVYFLKCLYRLMYNKLDFLFGTNVKYFILLIFIGYFILNIILCSFYLKINLPLKDLLPAQSYLSKHMVNHENYFTLGPIVILAFLTPLNYQPNTTDSLRVNSLKRDLKRLKGMNQLDLNWVDETVVELKSNYDLYEEFCSTPDNPKCFSYFLNQTKAKPQYLDDIVMRNSPVIPDTIEVHRSRFYLQFTKFEGSLEEVNLMHSLKDMAQEKYNFSKNELIIYSAVFGYLEQLSELFTTTLSIFLLAIECIFLGGLILIFDLNSLLILALICTSLVFSILSSFFYFNISINIVTLFHLMMLPSFVFEFFYHTPYLFLFKTDATRAKLKLNKTTSRKSALEEDEEKTSSGLNSKNRNTLSSSLASASSASNLTYSSGHLAERLKNLKFVFDTCTNTSVTFLLAISLFSFSILMFCTTYNFHTIYIFLLSTCINIIVHLSLFYPTLLILFGTLWKRQEARTATTKPKTSATS